MPNKRNVLLGLLIIALVLFSGFLLWRWKTPKVQCIWHEEKKQIEVVPRIDVEIVSIELKKNDGVLCLNESDGYWFDVEKGGWDELYVVYSVGGEVSRVVYTVSYNANYGFLDITEYW